MKMNSILRKTAAILLCLSLAIGLGACNKKEETTGDAIDQLEGIILAAWEEPDSPVVPEDVKAALEKAVDGLLGATYVPVAYLGSQIVSGHNYMVLCRVTPVVADPVETYAIVTFYEDTEGNVELTDVKDFGVETYLAEGMMGGWSEPESVELTDELRAAYEEAGNEDYIPVAVIGQQLVSGMNYRIVAEKQNVEPGHETNYVIVTLYKPLEGAASITDIAEMPLE